VTYTAVVCNVGSQGASAFAVDYFFNRTTPPQVGQPGDARQSVGVLGAGTCTAVPVTRDHVLPGTYTAWVLVDATNAVAEASEYNNVAGPKDYVVESGPPEPGVDLVVAAFRATTLESTVTYEAVVCNTGTQAAPAFVASLYYDRAVAPGLGDVGQQERAISSLGAGECVSLIFVRQATPPGTYNSWFQADTMDEVAESDELNNVAGPVVVTVGGGVVRADLVVASFLAEVVDNVVTYTASVCNVGSAAAVSFYVDIYYDLPNAPTTGQFGDQSRGVASLQPAECETLTFVRSSTPVGTYVSWCQVDSAQGVLESSESNNVAGPAVVNVGAGLDCSAFCTWQTSECHLPDFLYGTCQVMCQNATTAAQACAQEAMAQGECLDAWLCLY